MWENLWIYCRINISVTISVMDQPKPLNSNQSKPTATTTAAAPSSPLPSAPRYHQQWTVLHHWVRWGRMKPSTTSNNQGTSYKKQKTFWRGLWVVLGRMREIRRKGWRSGRWSRVQEDRTEESITTHTRIPTRGSTRRRSSIPIISPS